MIQKCVIHNQYQDTHQDLLDMPDLLFYHVNFCIVFYA